MSDITKLTNKIIQDAQEKQRILLEAGQAEIQAQIAELKRQEKRQSEKRLNRFEEKQQRELKRRISEAEVQARGQVLTERQRMIDEIFAEAVQKLKELDPKKFTQFVIQGLNKADFTGNVTLLLGGNSQKYATEQAIAEWKQAALPNIQLTISSEAVANRNGFILKQEYLELNFLFESLLEAAEEELSIQLLKLIFEEESEV